MRRGLLLLFLSIVLSNILVAQFDNCGDAGVPIATDGIAVSMDNLPANSADGTVWIQFTVVNDGPLNVSFANTGGLTFQVAEHNMPCGVSFISSMCYNVGDVVFIEIEESAGMTGTFDVTVSNVASPPANDMCGGAIGLVNGFSTPGDNLCSTPDFSDPTCPGSDENSVWYSYTMPASGATGLELSLSGTGGGTYMVMGLISDCNTFINNDPVYCGGDTPTPIEYTCLDPNATYFFQVSSSNIDAGNFNIQINEIVGNLPTNDDCATANAASGMMSTSFLGQTNACADPEWTSNGCPATSTEAAVWYEYTVPASGVSAVRIIINNFENPGATYTLMAFQDCNAGIVWNTFADSEFCAAGTIDAIFECVEPGEVISFQLSSASADAGTFDVEIQPRAGNFPTNDDCNSTATILPPNTPLTMETTNCATGDILIAGCGSDENTVWYEYVVPPGENGVALDVTFNTPGNEIGIQLIDDTCAGILTDTPNNPYCGISGKVRMECLEPGTYFIEVGTTDANAGDFTITATPILPNAACAGNDCNMAIDLGIMPSTCEFIENPGQCSDDACPLNLTIPGTGCDFTLGPTGFFSFTTDADPLINTIDIEVVNASFNNVFFGVFTDCNFNNAFCGENLTATSAELLDMPGMPNTTYYIAVTDPNGFGGSFDINIKVEPVPENDDPCPTDPNPPFDLTGVGVHNGTNCCAVGANDFPTNDWANVDCNAAQDDNAVWYTFTPDLAFDGVEIIVNGTTITGNTAVEVYIGDANAGCTGALTILESSCDPLSAEFRLSCFEPGDVLWIKVASADADCGEFSISAMNINVCVYAEECDDVTEVIMPVTDPNGTQQFQCQPGCLDLACPETTVNDCMFDQIPVVWFQVQTDAIAAQLFVNITTNGSWDPVFAIYGGDCAAMDLSILSNANNPACNLDWIDPSQIFQAVSENSTYWIAVGAMGEVDDPDFELCITSTITLVSCFGDTGPPSYGFDCSGNNNDFTYTVNSRDNDPDGSLGLPLDGPFCPGETINICMDIVYDASGTGIDWLQGIVPIYGEGWDENAADLGNLSGVTATGNGMTGVWFDDGEVALKEPLNWLCTFIDGEGNQQLCSGQCSACPDCPMGLGMDVGETLPGGWYWLQNGSTAPPYNCGNDGTPNEMYGIGSQTANVQVCMDIMVEEFADEAECENGGELKIGFQTFSDGVTGCWEDEMAECLLDVNQFKIFMKSCEVPPGVLAEPQELCNMGCLDIDASQDDGLSNATIIVTAIDNPDVIGETDHVFSNGFGTIDDCLENTSSSIQIVQYEMFTQVAGVICAGPTNIVEVTVYPQIIVVPQEDDVCEGALNGITICASPSGGTGVYNLFSWDHQGSMQSGPALNCISIPQPLTQGSYSAFVTVTDAFGCEGEIEVPYEIHPPVEIELDPMEINVCQADVNELIIGTDVTSGTPQYQYSWQLSSGLLDGTPNGDEYILDVSNSTTIIGFPSYVQVTVSDVNGCFIEDEVEVIISGSPVANVVPLPIPCGAMEALFNVTGQPGMGSTSPVQSIELVYNDPANGPTSITTIFNFQTQFTITQEGNYTVYVVDQNGCQGQASFDVDFTSTPIPSLSANQNICVGESTTLQVDNDGDYVMIEWSNMDSGASTTVTPTDTITYLVTVTDSDGCSELSSIEIFVSELPDAFLTGAETFCAGSSTTLDAGGNPNTWTYSWTLDGNTITGSGSQVTVGMPGTVAVTVTDENGCQNENTLDVTESTVIQLSIPNEDICAGGSTDLDAGSGFDSYEWFDPSGNPAGDSQIITISTPGDYTVNITDDGCNGVGTVTVQSFDPPSAVATDTVFVCNADNGLGQTYVDFNAQVLGDPGIWQDTELSGADITTDLTNVDFVDFPVDTFLYTYTTNSATAPCINVSTTMVVVIEDCQCLDPTTTAPDPICNVGTDVLLFTLETPSTDEGSWSFISGPATVDVSDDIFEGDGLPAGIYEVLFTLDEILGNCVGATTQFIEVLEAPSAIVVPDTILCNADIGQGPTMIDFNGLTDSDGEWTEPGIPGLDFSDISNVDFTDITPDTYLFQFTTNTAVTPCGNPTYNLLLTVQDCSCQNVVTLPPPNVCNDGSAFDLTNYQDANIGAGSWSLVSGPDMNALNGSIFDPNGIPAGDYEVFYTLDTPPAPGSTCPPGSGQLITVSNAPTVSLIPNTTVCNDPMSLGSTDVDFSSLFTGGDVNGDWTDDNGTGVDFSSYPIISFLSVPAGDYTFSYTTTSAVMPCMDVTGFVSINVGECLCPPFNTFEPEPLCETSGTIDLLDPAYTDPSSEPGSWYFSDGTPITGNILDPSVLPVGPSTIYYELDSPVTNCASSQTQVVTIVPQPNSGTPNGNIEFCADATDIVSLSDLLSGADPNGSWVESSTNPSMGGAFDAIMGTFNVTGQGADTYTFDYGFSNISPCQDVSTTVTIVINDLPVADAGLDQMLDCTTLEVPLGGTNTTPGVVYSWSEISGITVDNADQATTIANQAGTYILTVIDGDCQSSSQVVVELDPSTPAMTLEPTDITCFGFNDGIIDVTNITGGSGNYEYSIDGGTTWSTDPIFTNLPPGNYTILLRDDAGCEISQNISVEEPSALTLEVSAWLPVISLGNSDTIFVNANIDPNNLQSISITANGVDLGINSLVNDFVVTPTDVITEYCVEIVDLNGCSINQCVEVRTSQIIINEVYIANVFSPNGDFSNDNFFIQGGENLKLVNEMYIFDRWGEKIFGVENIPPNDPTVGWDGSFNGSPVVPGVYVYLVKVEFENGERRTISGDVTMLR